MNSASGIHARALVALLCLFLPALAAAQAAGRVLLAQGEVFVERAGREAALAAGAELFSGDVVRTGAASSAQLRFTDATLVALRSASRFHVVEYRHAADERNSSAVFALLKGGLRTITGLIGSTQRDRYRMRTPLATVGIRGTAYALVHCEADCEGDEGGAAPDGTYGLVFEGLVAVGNVAGEVEFGAEEAFYVPDANTLPQPLQNRPRLLRDRLEARARREQQQRAQAIAERREQLLRAALQADARLTTVDGRTVAVTGTPASPIVVTELQDGSGNIALLGSGLGAGVGFSTAAAAVGLVDGGRGTVIQLDGGRGLLDRFSFNQGGQAGDRGSARVLDSGRIEGDGGAVWGRWEPGAFVRVGEATAAPGTGVHFFFGNLTPESIFGVIPPGLASIQYTLAGGTRPTDESGNTGALLGGSFVVDLLHRSISGSISYGVDRVRYELPVPEGTPIVAGRGFVGFNVVGVGTGRWTCAGCPSPTGTLGHYNIGGLFLGSRAQGIGVVFGTQDPVVGRTAGTAIFRCVSGGCR